MAEDFANSFIGGALAGQRFRVSQQEQKREAMRLQFEQEDREIEKEILQHRMKELKIQERFRARDAARQNIQLLEGMDEANLPHGMSEEYTPLGSTPADELRRRPREIEVPGIPADMAGGVEIPSVRVRPETMQQQLARLLSETNIKQMGDVQNVPAGGALVQGGRELYRNPDRTRPPIIRTNRDAKGTETDVPLDPETFEPLSEPIATRQRLPQRPSTVVQVPQEDITDTVEGVKSGLIPVSAVTGLESKARLAITGRLAREGFNMVRAGNDQRAMATHASSLNSGQLNELRVSADVLDQALVTLDDINEKWVRGGFGPFNRAAIVAAKAQGGDQADLARQFEEAVANAQDALARVKSGGSAPTVRAVDDAMNALTVTGSKTSIDSAIRRLRASTGYLTGAIRGLDAVLPSGATSGGGMGGGEFDFDPATGRLIPRK